MKNLFLILAACLVCFVAGSFTGKKESRSHQAETVGKQQQNKPMKLGAFSVSLSVKDLKASRAFYEKLGFSAMGGDEKQNYLIMKNEHCLIGLFQGMFEGNILTFNPGWDENAKNFDPFDDIRKIQQSLLDQGVAAGDKIDSASGPGSFFVKDPDGNLLLFDQHR